MLKKENTMFFSIFKGNCMLPRRKWAQKKNIKKGK
jgi:hypothetical protein